MEFALRRQLMLNEQEWLLDYQKAKNLGMRVLGFFSLLRKKQINR